jgi:hypothetical protein
MKKKNIFSRSNLCEACEMCEAWVLLATTLSTIVDFNKIMEKLQEHRFSFPFI